MQALLAGGSAPGPLPAQAGRRHPRGCCASHAAARRQQLLPPSCRLPARQRARVVRVSAAAKTLYEVLGVGPGASEREIKRAYRQKALKLHPDVNKAPNAEAQFLEVKSAFSVLSDAQQRAAYDRKLQFGSWSASGGFGDFGGWGGGSSSTAGSGAAGGGGRGRSSRKKSFTACGVGAWVTQQAAELSKLQQGASGVLEGVAHKAGDALKAGKLEDFFNDLEKEVSSWSKARAASGKPASLWEELSAIGEEFVDFLEAGLGEQQQQGSGKEGSSERGSASFNSSSSQQRRPASPVDAYEQLKQRYDLYDEGSKSSNGGSSSSSKSSKGSSSSSRTTAGGGNGSNSSSSSGSSSSSRAAPPPPPKQKTRDEEVEDELAALKRKLGKL